MYNGLGAGVDGAGRLVQDIIDVKQGYTKCSLCPVRENAVITDDSGIEKALLKYLSLIHISIRAVKLIAGAMADAVIEGKQGMQGAAAAEAEDNADAETEAAAE